MRLLIPEFERPQWVQRSASAHWLTVAAVCLGAFMGQLDASIVTLAFPALQEDFQVPLSAVQWVSLSYLVVVAVALVPVGRLSDIHGRKLLYVNGFALFSLASILCAMAPSLWVLVAARAIQAAGAALYQANSVAIVTRVTPTPKLTLALGIQASAQSLGLALGPTIGGYMVQAWGWESVFWVNVPVGAVGIITASLFVPRANELRQPQGRDLTGVLLLGLTLLSLLALLSAMSGLHAPLWFIILMGVVTVLAAVGLFLRERRARDPLLPPSLFRGRVARGCVVAGLGYFVLFSPLVAYPQKFAEWHISAGRGGAIVALLPLGFAVFAILANAAPWTNHMRIMVGAVVMMASAGGAAWATSVAGSAAALFAVGCGLGLVVPANNAHVMAATPQEFSSVVGGVVNLMRSIGTTLGVAATTLCLHVWPGAPAVQIMLVCAAGLVLLLRR